MVRWQSLTRRMPEWLKDAIPKTARTATRNLMLKTASPVERPLLICVLDSCRYDVFAGIDDEWIHDSGKTLRKAYSTASWTIPGHEAIVRGRQLPLPTGGDAYDDVFETEYNTGQMPLSYEHEYAFSFTALQLLSPEYSVSNPFHTYFEEYECLARIQSAEEIADKAIAAMEKDDSFFGLLNFGETHHPWLIENEEAWEILQATADSEEKKEEALSLMQEGARVIIEQLKRIEAAAPDGTQFVVTADHGELMGENGQVGHGPGSGNHPKLFEVPLLHWVKNPGSAEFAAHDATIEGQDEEVRHRLEELGYM